MFAIRIVFGLISNISLDIEIFGNTTGASISVGFGSHPPFPKDVNK